MGAMTMSQHKSYMHYKEYYTKVEYSKEDNALIGRIEGIQDIISFDAQSLDKFEEAFHDSVDNYLDLCMQIGKEPQKAYTGSFNVRISPEKHSELADIALKSDKSLNSLVDMAIDQFLKSNFCQGYKAGSLLKFTQSQKWTSKSSSLDERLQEPYPAS